MSHPVGSGGPLTATSVHIKRAREGDAESTTWIVERFHPLLVATARYRLGGALKRLADPEDVVDETWLAALPQLATIGSPEARAAPVLLRFLSAVLFNRIRDLARRSLNRARLAPSAESSSAPLSEIARLTRGAVTRLVDDERAKAVRDAIGDLSPDDREILVLRGIEGASYAEIEAAVGTSAKAAAMRYGRALERLRRALPGGVFDEFDAD